MYRFDPISVRLVSLALGLVLWASVAHAKKAEFKCSDATKAGTVKISIEVQPYGMATYSVPISGPMSAADKRDAIFNWFVVNQPQIAIAKVGADRFSIDRLKGGTYVWFSPGDTGEGRDQVASAGTPHGTTAYTGLFQAFDMAHQPAVFTAGIVTDIGVLSVQVSASELNFQTDGPIICQALFSALAPRAPQYGAQINYAGDRLEVYFDPAYTVTQGGIIFGTTSPTPGCTGTLLLPPDPVDTTPPTIQSADSIRTQGSAGEFRLPLHLDETLPMTIEPRAGGVGRIILGFSEPIDSSSTAQLSVGAANITVSGDQMIIDNITGVPDGVCLTIALNVSDAAGNPLAGTQKVRLGVLAGDADQNGSVDLNDALSTRLHIGQPVGKSNFLYDLTCSGSINLSDALLARSRLGRVLTCP